LATVRTIVNAFVSGATTPTPTAAEVASWEMRLATTSAKMSAKTALAAWVSRSTGTGRSSVIAGG